MSQKEITNKIEKLNKRINLLILHGGSVFKILELMERVELLSLRLD
jgi:hypothetical protein